MTRNEKAEDRIDHIPDGTATSRRSACCGFATILLLGAPEVFLAAAQAPGSPASPATPLALQAPSSPGHNTARVTRYLIVSGDDKSGSWDSRDESRFEKWRSEYGSHYAWFRQDGRDYIVTDGRIMAQFEDAMAPQREVNSRQTEVNRHQADVNRLQDGVNSHQADVNRAQAEVNLQQSLVNRGGGEPSHVNQRQLEVNAKQHAVNGEQDKVNQRQALVNEEQGQVNQMQTRASAEIDKTLQAVFDSARRQGLVHQAH
jgi:hypothetical protein